MFRLPLESVLPEFDHYLAMYTLLTLQYQFQPQSRNTSAFNDGPGRVCAVGPVFFMNMQILIWQFFSETGNTKCDSHILCIPFYDGNSRLLVC
jgi:hypothetical protein